MKKINLLVLVIAGTLLAGCVTGRNHVLVKTSGDTKLQDYLYDQRSCRAQARAKARRGVGSTYVHNTGGLIGALVIGITKGVITGVQTAEYTEECLTSRRYVKKEMTEEESNVLKQLPSFEEKREFFAAYYARERGVPEPMEDFLERLSKKKSFKPSRKPPSGVATTEFDGEWAMEAKGTFSGGDRVVGPVCITGSRAEGYISITDGNLDDTLEALPSGSDLRVVGKFHDSGHFVGKLVHRTLNAGFVKLKAQYDGIRFSGNYSTSYCAGRFILVRRAGWESFDDLQADGSEKKGWTNPSDEAADAEDG